MLARDYIKKGQKMRFIEILLYDYKYNYDEDAFHKNGLSSGGVFAVALCALMVFVVIKFCF